VSGRELGIDDVLVEGTSHHPVGCTACGTGHLVADEALHSECLWCGHGDMDKRPALVSTSAPELAIPFAIDDPGPPLRRFARGVWFRCKELDARLLTKRARRVWWPMWLVDTRISGHWSAEMGFDYQVSSAQEELVGGEWVSTDVLETRIRWEERLGTLEHHYDNTEAVACAKHAALGTLVGDYEFKLAVACDPTQLDAAALHLPDIDPDGAWPTAEERLMARSGAHARIACDAQHMRGFSMTASFEDQHWTWMLLPLWSTWYTDAAGVRRIIFINGQTGKVGGPRMASPSKGAIWAVALFFVVVGISVVSALCTVLTFVFPPILIVAIFGWVFALLLFIAMFFPFFMPRGWNRGQRQHVIV
jgi:hypothetical protein